MDNMIINHDINNNQNGNKSSKNKPKLKRMFFLTYSILSLLGIITCAICDVAISGTFTWSLIPICSIIFAWLLTTPIMKLGYKGICGFLITLSLLIVPYVYLLNILIGTNEYILSIGIRVSIISIIYLWIIFGIINVLKNRKLIAYAISIFLALPVYYLIDVILLKILNEPLFDIWDIFSLIIIGIISIIFFILDFYQQKRKRKVIL